MKFLCILMLCVGLGQQAYAQRVVDDGSYRGIEWRLTSDGTLTFSGNGAIGDFNKYNDASPNTSDRPWQRQRQKVKRVVVENGNTITIYTIDGNNGGSVTEDTYTVRKSDGTLDKGKGRLYYLVAPDYENSSIETHKVTFVPRGGMIDYHQKKVATGGLYGPMPVAEKHGAKFVGWFTNPEGGKRVNIYTPVRRKTDETLFAHYE